MSMEWKHRGRIITPDDIHFIQQLIDANPQASRRRLSAKLCEAWQWKQANGALRDMVCRGLLLMLDRAGQIQLPPIKKRPNNPLARRPKPAPLLIDTGPIQEPLSELQPIHIQQVRRTGDESLYNSLIEQHHYLGYEQPVGEHLKSGLPRSIHRMEPGGASAQHPIHCAYNTRFLIVPWVQVPHLASHILGYIARVVSRDWEPL